MLSNKISCPDHGISEDEFCILSDEDMAKRDSIGKRLKTARLNLGMSVPELRRKILDDHRAEIGASTIRDIEGDKTPNPGFKTLEFIALGVGLDPLEVMSLGLDDPPELEAGFSETQFGQMARVYKTVAKAEKSFVDNLIKMVIAEMERRR